MTVNADLLKKPLKLLQKGEKLAVRRPGPVRYVKGRPQERPGTKFSIVANVQPVMGKELLKEEPGERERRRLWVYTRTKLKVDDKMTRHKELYQIEIVEEWGSYFKARAALVDVD